MQDSSTISLNEASVENNVRFLKKKLGSRVRLSAVVKANAYGHGIEEIVPLFEKHGVDHFSAFYYDEALRISKALSTDATVMIMGWISNKNLPVAIKRGFEFFVFNQERLKATIDIAQQIGIKAKIHLEAETGMNRSGFSDDELPEAMALLNEHRDHIELVGLCTHLAGAESISNHVRIQKQLKKFQRVTTLFERNGLKPGCRHVANSAAAFVYPAARFDMVRVGIMMYGFWSSTETFIHYLNNRATKTDPLKRILGWKTHIMSIKSIKAGEFVSYGISYLAQTNLVTALMPVGYASGYSRSLSNKGKVLIQGQLCSIIGLVNMNMIIADVTHISGVAVGEEVVIIGKQGDLEIKVSAFSDFSDKLNYEVLTHLPATMRRVVLPYIREDTNTIL
jgi:alanine racemase